jgi:hypothetical protein
VTWIEWISLEANRDIVLFVVSGLAFIMSLSSWVHTWTTQRRNLEISIIKYYKVSEYHYFMLSLENRSRLPITISRFKAMFGGEAVQCSLTPIIVKETTRTYGNSAVERTNLFSAQFPLAIGSLGGISEIIVFQNSQEEPEDSPTHWIFQVYTNRGRSFQVKLPRVDPACKKDFP